MPFTQLCIYCQFSLSPSEMLFHPLIPWTTGTPKLAFCIYGFAYSGLFLWMKSQSLYFVFVIDFSFDLIFSRFIHLALVVAFYGWIIFYIDKSHFVYLSFFYGYYLTSFSVSVNDKTEGNLIWQKWLGFTSDQQGRTGCQVLQMQN